MSYIKKIILENFQSHEYTEVDFSKGMNVIVGHSDSGKTAILRAIRWCLYNEPGGYEFIREGQTQVKVIIFFQNEVSVTRLRSKSKNQYILNSLEEELIFEGFGTQVPEEIIEATGIQKIPIDEKKSFPLNYAAQLEGPFLLNESDSFKATAIGRLVGVNIIDETMRETLRDKKQLSTEISLKNKSKEEFENKIKEYDYLEDYKKIQNKLKNQYTILSSKKDEYENLSYVLKKYQELQAERKKAEEFIGQLPDIDKLDRIVKQLEVNILKKREYRSLFDKLKRQFNDMKQAENTIEERNYTESLENILFNTSNVMEKYKSLYPLYRSLILNNKEKENINLKIKKLRSIEKISYEKIEKSISYLKLAKEVSLNFKVNSDRIHKGENFLNNYETLEDIEKKNMIIKEKIDILNEIRKISISYNSCLMEQKDKLVVLKNSENMYSLLKKDYINLLEKVGTCPLCHQNIDGDSIHHINHYLEEV